MPQWHQFGEDERPKISKRLNMTEIARNDEVHLTAEQTWDAVATLTDPTVGSFSPLGEKQAERFRLEFTNENTRNWNNTNILRTFSTSPSRPSLLQSNIRRFSSIAVDINPLVRGNPEAMDEIMGAIDKGWILHGFYLPKAEEIIGKTPKLTERKERIHPDLYPEAKITIAHITHIFPMRVKGDKKRQRTY